MSATHFGIAVLAMLVVPFFVRDSTATKYRRIRRERLKFNPRLR